MFALVFFLYIITICTSYMCIYVLCVRLTFVYHVFFFLMLYICILSYIQVVHVIIYLYISIY